MAADRFEIQPDRFMDSGMEYIEYDLSRESTRKDAQREGRDDRDRDNDSSENTETRETQRTDEVPYPVVHHGIKTELAITINRTPEEVYRFWREPGNLHLILSHLERVDPVADSDTNSLVNPNHTAQDRRTHWVWRTLGDMKLEWDAEIIADVPDKMVSWQTLKGADVPHAGSIWFLPAPEGRGTEVRLLVSYDPPGGRVGNALAALFGESPRRILHEDLRRLKWLMETGEIPTIAGQPTGPGTARKTSLQATESLRVQPISRTHAAERAFERASPHTHASVYDSTSDSATEQTRPNALQ